MLTVPAYLTGFSSLKDGGASIRFSTQELSAEDFAQLSQAQNDFGYLAFKPNQVKQSDMPVEDALDTTKKPSQRLRAVLFVLWQQRGSQGDFEVYYREQMEKLITVVKAKLD